MLPFLGAVITATLPVNAHNAAAWISGLVLAAGRAMLGDKIEEVEILHGTTGHIGLVTHPTVLGHLAGRYEFGAPSKLVVVAS